MIRKTIDIFKARWPEAVLLIVMQTALTLLLEEVFSRTAAMESSPEPSWSMFFAGAGCMGLMIVWQILFMGFLKTAAMEGTKPQEPMALLSAGRPYLWRVFGYQFLIAMCLWFLSTAIITGFYFLQGQVLPSKPPAWLIEVSGAAAAIILIKPIFLIPAFIIVLDMTIAEAFVKMMQIRLGQIRELFIAIVIGFAAVTAVGVALSFAPEQGPLSYAALAINYLAKGTNLLLLMTVTAFWTASTFIAQSSEQEGNESDNA